jgi:octaprenyl-diphosphate synthase
MSVALASLKNVVKEELGIFDRKFKEAIKTDVALLDTIMKYILRNKGKRMRPLLVFYSAKLFGDTNESTYTAASMLELLHTASLVHDDVVDESYQRRGMFSINALWKNKIAILVGDYLLSTGLLVSLRNKEYDLLQLLSETVESLSKGELLQIEKARRLDIDERIYYDIIKKKTASMIASACAAGAASTTDDKDMIQKCWDMGENLGMAYQIRDDLFDYTDEETGKPKAADLKEKKMTLPLIFALSKGSSSQKRRMINIVKKYHDEKGSADELYRMITELGGMEYAGQRMNDYKENALEILDDLPEAAIKPKFRELIQYVIDRNI